MIIEAGIQIPIREFHGVFGRFDKITIDKDYVAEWSITKSK